MRCITPAFVVYDSNEASSTLFFFEMIGLDTINEKKSVYLQIDLKLQKLLSQ